MNRQALWTVIIGVVLTVAVVAGAFVMLRTVNDPGPENGAQAPEDAGPLTTDALLSEVGDRPDCPATGAGGVALDCLGGENSAAAAEGITVVNVWAWQKSVRDELPYFDEPPPPPSTRSSASSGPQPR